MTQPEAQPRQDRATQPRAPPQGNPKEGGTGAGEGGGGGEVGGGGGGSAEPVNGGNAGGPPGAARERRRNAAPPNSTGFSATWCTMAGRSRRYSAAIAATARPAPTTRSPRRRQFSGLQAKPLGADTVAVHALARRHDDLEPGVSRRPRDRQAVRPEIPILGDQKDQLRPLGAPAGRSKLCQSERWKLGARGQSRDICRQYPKIAGGDVADGKNPV